MMQKNPPIFKLFVSKYSVEKKMVKYTKQEALNLVQFARPEATCASCEVSDNFIF
jgi:hypothetical protein